MLSSSRKFKILCFTLICMNVSPGCSWSFQKIVSSWLHPHSHFGEPDEYNDVCRTGNCKKTGKILLQGLNRDVDPCDDFYEFACGRWAISNPIPPKHLDWNCMKISEREIEERSLEILDSKLPLNAPNASKMLRQFFNDCMDVGGREKAGLIPIHNVTKPVGGWPLIGNSTYSNEMKWQQVDQYYLKLTSSYSIYKVLADANYLTRGNNHIQITFGQLPRPEFFPLATRWKGWPKNDTLYTKFVKKVAKIFLNDQNIKFTTEDFDNDMFDMLQFEYQLYKIQLNATNPSKDLVSIEELQQHYDSMAMLPGTKNREYKPTVKINWLKTIREIFAPWNFTIDDSEILFIPSWEFFSRLPQLLNATKNKAIVNYIHWHFVMLMMPFMNDRLKELLHTASGKTFYQTYETRRRDCLTETRLNDALYREYAQKYFSQSEKKDIENMAQLIRQQTIQMVKRSHWIDVTTKTKFIEKLEDIHIMIGYPDWYDDNGTVLDNYYKRLIPGHSHFENTLHNIKFVNDNGLAEFRQPMKKYEWHLRPLTLNGLYKYYYNSLLVTMAFAKSPAYFTDLPLAVKYGLLGSIIGHELCHSIDPYGIGYDKDWREHIAPATTKKNYTNKIGCIVDQLNGRKLFEKDPTTGETVEVKIKGNITKSEDMADIEGIRVAFDTYRANLKDNKPSRLVGLDEFNSDKLFFISYANKWCHTAKAKWWKDNYGSDKYDEHSPSRLRVNKPMSNFEEFAKAFNCPIGSHMNPPSKCRVFG